MNLKAYKYRIYPNDEQKVLLGKHFGCVRWFYNYALAKKKSAYEKDKTKISRFDLQAELPILKKQQDTAWLSEVDSQTLQATLINLDQAYKTFFKTKKGFPKFKKKRNKQSYSLPQRVSVNFETSKIELPKIGRVKIELSRKFNGKIKTVTISKTSTDKYFASILVEIDETLPPKQKVTLQTSIGVDLGLSHFAIFDNGEKIDNPRHLKNEQSRLKVLQHRASKKKKGSANRKKANKKVSLLHERIANKRLDFLHKLSYRLTHDNQVGTICMEDLAVKNMVKNHNLAQAISDVSWSKFVEFLKYKSEWYGKNFVQIGRFESSSKTCGKCGFKNNELSLSIREWTCNNCNTCHDRDVNAANNIRNIGVNILTGKALPDESVELSAIAEAKKQEYLNKIRAKHN